MVTFLIKRLIGSLAVLFGLSLLAHLLIYLTPGDPATIIIAQWTGRDPTADQLAQVRAEYGLDRPPLLQYFFWAGQAVRGNFGYSIRTGQPVILELAVRLGPTLLLATTTTLTSIIVGIPIGFLAAIKEDTWWDHVIRTVTLLSVSIPNFWLAFLFILVFSIYLNWLPSHGMQGPQYLILPVTCLGLTNAARLGRLTRSCFLGIQHEQFLVAARAKGLTRRLVWVRHALPNISVPLLTLSATQFSHIAAGSVVIEALFAWPGIANYFVVSVNYRDIPAIQAMVVLFGVIFVTLNIVADIACVLVDPRIRLK